MPGGSCSARRPRGRSRRRSRSWSWRAGADPPRRPHLRRGRDAHRVGGQAVRSAAARAALLEVALPSSVDRRRTIGGRDRRRSLADRAALAARPRRDGLYTLHRAYLESVPYEDLACSSGDRPLDFPLLASRVASGRGGYCFELNTVLAGLLRACGFEVTHHQAVVGGEGPINHMALLVPLDGETWLADAGLGEGFLDPLPFREGSTRSARSPRADRRGRHLVDDPPRVGLLPGFRMAASRLSSPTSRSTTAPGDLPGVVLREDPRPAEADGRPDHDPALAHPVLDRPVRGHQARRRRRRRVHVDPGSASSGSIAGERLDRLWTQALVQHEAFLARETPPDRRYSLSPASTSASIAARCAAHALGHAVQHRARLLDAARGVGQVQLDPAHLVHRAQRALDLGAQGRRVQPLDAALGHQHPRPRQRVRDLERQPRPRPRGR